MSDLDLYIGTTEAAKMLGFTPRYIRYLCQTGQLTHVMRAGRLFVSRASLTLFAQRTGRRRRSR